MWLKRLLGVLMNLFFLTSCSLFPAVENTSPHWVLLSEKPQVRSNFAIKPKILFVARPVIFSPFSSQLIAYFQQKNQINYFSKHQWAADPAEMMRVLLVQTLQDSQHFKAVIKDFSEGKPNFILNIWITDLSEDLTGISPVFRITAQVVLLDALHQKIISSQKFVSISVLKNSSFDAAIVSANTAMKLILKQINAFCVKKI